MTTPRFNSRNKGSVGEREVAKLLQPWWRQVEPECQFVKTPLSGGWGGKELRAGFNASGDLMTTASLFPFTVEVKRREGWNLKNVLNGKDSPVWGWWKQALTQAEEMSCTPMLWLRKNNQPWYLMVPEEFAFKYELPKLQVEYAPEDLEVLPAIVLATEFLARDPHTFRRTA